MTKKIILIFLIFLTAGCTVVRIDASNIDNIVSVVLSKDNKLYNRVGIGYKYYVPRGVTYIDSDDTNDRLYSNGIYYYLYLNEVGYYYKCAIKYKEDKTKYYSKKLHKGKKKGYLEITKKNNLYLIQFVYNYAKIETLVPKKEIEQTILNSSYILSTIKYNRNIIKLSLDNNYLGQEKKYEEFTSKKESNNFLNYEKE